MIAPKVSVIMGIYNCADTLNEAIDSIINQTFAGWVFIICDDGSTDASYSIAMDYAKRYPDQFIVIKNERNMGLNYTLNHCLEYVDTEFVARMDGDDISLPQRFEKLLEAFDEEPDLALKLASVFLQVLNTDDVNNEPEKPIIYS